MRAPSLWKGAGRFSTGFDVQWAHSGLHTVDSLPNSDMSLSESQLQTWSNQGATTSSQNTYNSIREALKAYSWPPEYIYEVYLQGSYRNSTNTRGNSDVDVVAELTSSFQHDLSDLSEPQRRSFHESHLPASHGWPEFRTHLEAAMRSYYGSSRVTSGKKCLTVQTPYLQADLLACQSYRDYDSTYQSSPYLFPYGEGIMFYVPAESRWVVNYPKLHYKNGAGKNSRTTNNYKPVVRCFKNARRYLCDRGFIAAGLAPSYFVECLLYNVPDSAFRGSFQSIFVNVLNRLLESELNEFVSQNGRVWLFGHTPEQWDTAKAHTLIGALVDLWNE